MAHVHVEIASRLEPDGTVVAFKAYLPDGTLICLCKKLHKYLRYRQTRQMYKDALGELAEATTKRCLYTSYTIKFVKTKT